MRTGNHLFLTHNARGLLEVTEAHTTWMDAQLDGAAVTPRVGELPEINALWFQARVLNALWSGVPGNESDRTALVELARLVMSIRESGRPNSIFLFSIPISPYFFLKSLGEEIPDHSDVIADLKRLWTPVGLRTLAPGAPGYQPHCEGTQAERDRAYHQGSVWGWLGGHARMAQLRVKELADLPKYERLSTFPIAGHIPEIFDAEAPHAPRGTPAQAWSLACLDEARAREELKVDETLKKLIAKRWGAAKAPASKRGAKRAGRSSPGSSNERTHP